MMTYICCDSIVNNVTVRMTERLLQWIVLIQITSYGFITVLSLTRKSSFVGAHSRLRRGHFLNYTGHPDTSPIPPPITDWLVIWW
jgi:hypothetical protein